MTEILDPSHPTSPVTCNTAATIHLPPATT
jgi:hypothetical protein